MGISNVSSASNPYETGSYSAKANEKNTLTIESYFKLYWCFILIKEGKSFSLFKKLLLYIRKWL